MIFLRHALLTMALVVLALMLWIYATGFCLCYYDATTGAEICNCPILRHGGSPRLYLP